jgi:hypothetical protein
VLAVNELSAELDGVVCVNPAADAVAGFEHGDFEIGAAEFARGGKSGDASADDDEHGDC